MNKKENSKVIVAMSGGVDSSVAALLLIEQGYQVIGATLDFGFGHAVNQAMQVCSDLKIEHKIIDAQKMMIERVIKPFASSYLQGKTPNPCVDCNATVKFPLFLPLMQELGADYLATGHYVRLVEKNNRYILNRAIIKDKDQSYFMYRIPQEILKLCIFPLGDFNKAQVREIASQNNLSSAQQKDSFDICFINNGDYRQCISDYDDGSNKPGDIVDQEGKFLGKHCGLANYTIGQRKGLNLALGYPAYVIELNQEANNLVIGPREELFGTQANVCQLVFMPFDKLEINIEVQVQIRYGAQTVSAIIDVSHQENDCASIIFTEPVWALTPGQSAVFYDEELLIGGGYIFKRINIICWVLAGTFLWGIAGAIFALPVVAVGNLLSKYIFGRLFSKNYLKKKH